MERLSLPIQSNFEKVEQINEEFGKYRCRVMALGKNRNGSYFSKEAVDAAIPSFKNVPIVGFIYEDDNGTHMKGHEHEVVRENGNLEYKSKCVPYGVVPADTAFEYVDVTEDDGSVATYLCCDAILWEKRYPELVDAMNSGDEKFGQSMEITVKKAKKYAEDKRYIDIQKFNASALCLLGKDDSDESYNVEPCFPSCALLSYAEDNQFIELMDEFKSALMSCFANINNEEGGATVENVENIVSNEDQVIEPQESFEENGNIEEPVVEETPIKEPNVEQPTFVDKAKQFAVTYRKKIDAIYKVLDDLATWGEEKSEWYNYLDMTDDYVMVSRNVYDKDGRTFEYGRFYYDYNENEDKAYLTSEFEKMYVEWLTQAEKDAVDALRDEYAAYKAEHSYSNSDYEELKEFKANRLAEDHKNEVDAVLAQFSDLEGNQEFELLKENALNIDKIEVLEDKCFALRGRMVKVEPAVEEHAERKTVIIKKTTNFESANPDEKYGGLMAKYGY